MKKIKALLAGMFLVGCSGSSSTVQKITPQEAKTMIDKGNVVIIDVREKDEYLQGHIQDSLLIPLSTIQENNQQLPQKKETLFIYCRSGHRSHKAAIKLISMGYEHVYDFGGIIDWPYNIVQ